MINFLQYSFLIPSTDLGTGTFRESFINNIGMLLFRKRLSKTRSIKEFDFKHALIDNHGIIFEILYILQLPVLAMLNYEVEYKM